MSSRTYGDALSFTRSGNLTPQKSTRCFLREKVAERMREREGEKAPSLHAVSNPRIRRHVPFARHNYPHEVQRKSRTRLERSSRTCANVGQPVYQSFLNTASLLPPPLIALCPPSTFYASSARRCIDECERLLSMVLNLYTCASATR